MSQTFNLFGDPGLARDVGGVANALFGNGQSALRQATALGTVARARAQTEEINAGLGAGRSLSEALRDPAVVGTPEGRARLYSIMAGGGPDYMRAGPQFVRGYAGAMPWAGQNERDFSFLAAGAGSNFENTPEGQRRDNDAAMARRLVRSGGGGGGAGEVDGDGFSAPTRVQPAPVTVTRAASESLRTAVRDAWSNYSASGGTGSLSPELNARLTDRAGQIFQRTRNPREAAEQAIRELEEVGGFRQRNREIFGMGIPGTSRTDLPEGGVNPQVESRGRREAPDIPTPLRTRPRLQWNGEQRLWRDPGTGQVFNADGTNYVPPTRGRSR